jgi:hypothetical protein
MRNGWQDGSAIVMGNGGGDGQWWRQWATAGVTIGDSNSGSMILMALMVVVQWMAGRQQQQNGSCHVWRRKQRGQWRWRQGWRASDGNSNERAMAMAMRMAGNKEGNGDSDKSNGDGVEDGG